jgi:uncharacterized protein with PQ loop repeat
MQTQNSQPYTSHVEQQSKEKNYEKAVTTYTPILTAILLESANVGQIYRMITEHSAKGQSLAAWIVVWCALALWINYYRVIGQKSALYATIVGLVLNTVVISTVIYFRYVV